MNLPKKLYRRILGKESWEKLRKDAFFQKKKKNAAWMLKRAFTRKTSAMHSVNFKPVYQRNLACFNDATNF